MPRWWTQELTITLWMAVTALAFIGGMCVGVWIVENRPRIERAAS